MIKVTLEFHSVAEAIVALSKVINLPAVKEVTPEWPTGKRRARADKGKKRGEYAPRTDNASTSQVEVQGSTAPQTSIPVNVEAPSTAAANTQVPAEGDKPQPSGTLPVAAATSSATAEEAQSALEKVFAAKGIDAARGLLKNFGVNRLHYLKPEQRGEFVIAAEEVCKGEPV